MVDFAGSQIAGWTPATAAPPRASAMDSAITADPLARRWSPHANQFRWCWSQRRSPPELAASLGGLHGSPGGLATWEEAGHDASRRGARDHHPARRCDAGDAAQVPRASVRPRFDAGSLAGYLLTGGGGKDTTVQRQQRMGSRAPPVGGVGAEVASLEQRNSRPRTELLPR